MEGCITYCLNHNCSRKYRCARYRDLGHLKGNEFWFDKLDPKYCEEGNDK